MLFNHPHVVQNLCDILSSEHDFFFISFFCPYNDGHKKNEVNGHQNSLITNML